LYLLIKGFTWAVTEFGKWVADMKGKWVLAGKDWNNFVKWITDGWRWIVEGAKGMWAWLVNIWNTGVNFLKLIWQAVVDWLYLSWQEKLNSIAWLFGYVIGLIVVAALGLWNNLVAVWEMIKAAAIWVWETIKQAAINAFNTVVNFFVALPQTFSNIWESIKVYALWAWDYIKDTAVTKFTELVTWMTGLPAQAVQIFEDFKKGIIEKFTGVKSEAETSMTGVVDNIKAIDLKQIGIDMIQGLIDGIKSMVGNVGNAVKDIGNSISSGFTQAMRDAKVPGFASGVTNFSGGWAVVGEQGPELVNLPKGSDVIPNGKTTDILSSQGGGQTNNFYISGAGNPQAVAQAVIQILSRQNNLASQGLNR